jgi:hypothetical protein
VARSCSPELLSIKVFFVENTLKKKSGNNFETILSARNNQKNTN